MLGQQASTYVGALPSLMFQVSSNASFSSSNPLSSDDHYTGLKSLHSMTFGQMP